MRVFYKRQNYIGPENILIVAKEQLMKKRALLQGGRRELLGMMKMEIFIVIYVIIKAHQITHFKRINFIVCKLCLIKSDKNYLVVNFCYSCYN